MTGHVSCLWPLKYRSITCYLRHGLILVLTFRNFLNALPVLPCPMPWFGADLQFSDLSGSSSATWLTHVSFSSKSSKDNHALPTKKWRVSWVLKDRASCQNGRSFKFCPMNISAEPTLWLLGFQIFISVFQIHIGTMWQRHPALR